jgi:hypothetical protein
MAIRDSLHFRNNFTTLIRMGRGRPPKGDGERKAKDLRIPVTEEQKRLIAEAMQISGEDMATWARPILLVAAQGIITAANKRKPRRNP